jgi:hypothetical protein
MHLRNDKRQNIQKKLDLVKRPRKASFIYVYMPDFVDQGEGIGGDWP